MKNEASYTTEQKNRFKMFLDRELHSHEQCPNCVLRKLEEGRKEYGELCVFIAVAELLQEKSGNAELLDIVSTLEPPLLDAPGRMWLVRDALESGDQLRQVYALNAAENWEDPDLIVALVMFPMQSERWLKLQRETVMSKLLDLKPPSNPYFFLSAYDKHASMMREWRWLEKVVHKRSDAGVVVPEILNIFK